MARKKKILSKERRKFVRLDYIAPLALKVCKNETVNKIMQGYTADVSQAGLQCTIKQLVRKNDLLWISFDRATLIICEEIDRRSLIYQNGIIGRVVRVKPLRAGEYSIGIQFLTREEKNSTHIFPKINFLYRSKKTGTDTQEDEPEVESGLLEELTIGEKSKAQKIENSQYLENEKEDDAEAEDLGDEES